jgi:hypothetical protein
MPRLLVFPRRGAHGETTPQAFDTALERPG